MRNNTFLVITILLVGALFCLGVKKWETKKFPDQRGQYIAPRSNIQYRGSQISRDENATRPTINYGKNLTTRHYANKRRVGISSLPSESNGVGMFSSQTYDIRRTEASSLHSGNNGASGQLYLHSTATMHSVGGGISSNASNTGIAIRRNTNNYSVNTGGVASLSLPTINNSSLLAINNAIPDETKVRSQMRTVPRIGYSTQNTAYNGIRKRAPYYDEGDGKWYDDETGDEVHPGSNIPGLDAGGYVGQTTTFGGKNYQWNGTEWVDLAPNPLPIGNGLWILLLLAVVYGIITSKVLSSLRSERSLRVQGSKPKTKTHNQ